MTQSVNELERDIEESRARLDLTLDRIQDKLSVSGIVDDVMGSVRRTHYADAYDSAIAVIRRNPIPVMLVAAGVGWLLHRMAKEPVHGRALVPYAGPPEELLRPRRRQSYAPVASSDPIPMGGPVASDPRDSRDPLDSRI